MKVVILGSYPTYPFSKELNVPHVGRKLSTWLMYFAKYLSQYPGIELHVVSEDEYLNHDYHFQSDNITFHFLKCPKKYKAATFFVGDVLRIRKEIKKINPDIINAHHTDEYALAAVKSNYPYVITVHGILSRFVPKRKLISRQKIISIIEKYVLKRAKNLIASSPFVHEAIGGITKAKFYDIENCLDEKYFNKLKDYSINYKLIYIGYIIQDKGVDQLIKLMSLLKKEFPDVHLTIVGNKSNYELSFYDDLIMQIQNEDLQKNISFAGFISEDEKLNLLLESTILVHPSRLETFCMSVAEAMATGTPVITTRVGGIPFTVGIRNLHSLYALGDVDELYSKIKELFNSQPLRETYGEINKKEAFDRFHPKVVIENLVDCFNDIIKESALSRSK